MASKVAVLILSYNRPEFLPDMVDSVLAQTLRPDEIGILDNGSGPEVRRSISGPLEAQAIQWEGLPTNIGSLKNFDRALDCCRADYIAIVHDDDRLKPTYLQKLVEFLDGRPDVGAVGCKGELISEDGWEIRNKDPIGPRIEGPSRMYSKNGEVALEYASDSCLIFGSFLYRRSVLSHHRLDSELGKVSDVSFLANIAESSSLACLAEPLYQVRVHGLQDSSEFAPGVSQALDRFLLQTSCSTTADTERMRSLLSKRITYRSMKVVQRGGFTAPMRSLEKILESSREPGFRWRYAIRYLGAQLLSLKIPPLQGRQGKQEMPEKQTLRRSSSPILLAILWLALVYGSMNLAFSIRSESLVFDLTHSVPATAAKGMDFGAVLPMAVGFIRNGVSGYLQAALEMKNVYPPFYTWFILPTAFFPQATAYALWVFSLHFALIALVYLGLRSAKDLTSKEHFFAVTCLSLALFQSYPFLFALERGNGDTFAALFSALALITLTSRRPNLASPLLALAVQLKLYPAVLAVILFGRRGWKPLLVFSAWVFLGFFVMGWDAFVFFLKSMRSFTKDPFLWPGNHSLASYVYRIHEALGWSLPALKFWGKGLLAVFLVTFGVSWFRIYRKNKVQALVILPAEKALAGMAFQLMSLLPSTSHDYKLVIQYFPFLWVAATPFAEFRSSRGFVSVTVVLLAASVGYLMSPLSGSMGIKTSAILVSFFCYAAITLSETREEA